MKIAVAMLILSAQVFAQDETARRQAVEVSARVPFEKAMKGAPYSAETIVEGSQTLADGNRISRKTTGQVYRDSEGRTRREEDVTLTTKSANGPVSTVRKTISIVDPVAGFSYSLDPENRIAWQTPAGGAGAIAGKLELLRMEMEKMVAERKAGAGDAQSRAAADEEKVKAAAAVGGRGGRGGGAGVPAGAAAGGGGRARGTVAVAMMPDTPLEHKTIEGVAVEGRKTTTIIPAGQVGNEQPITITSEEWRSPELNLLVLTKHADPRTGESSYRLQNIIRAEPDRSLFMVPPDYTVRETGIRKMVEASMKKD
jgi:hypothetical protein